MNSVEVNKIKIYCPMNTAELIGGIVDLKIILIAINAEKLMIAHKDLVDIINNNFGYPDGIGAVWAIRRKGINAIKIPGVELWLKIIEKSYLHKSFYLIGSTEEVVTKTVKKIQKLYSGIRICGFRNGFFDGHEEEVINDITVKKPDFVFVAIGSPKQEFFMNKAFKSHPALYMGLGGSFDVFTGIKRRAPKVFIRLKLEWLYRLLHEPTRLRRQLVLVKFLKKLIFNKI